MIKTWIRIGLALILFSAPLAVASAATITLSTSTTFDSPPRNFLRTIDTLTGVPSPVTEIIGITGQVTDIAYHPSGALYAINASNLYRVDEATGAATDIGRTLQFTELMVALAFDASGTLYAASSSSSNLFTLDPTTGVATLAGALPPGYSASGDLAFDDAGVLWATTTNTGGFTTDHLARLTPGGVGTDIGDLGRRVVFGLAFADGQLYGTGGAVHEIDRDTGSVLNDIGGLSFVTGADVNPIPEPGTASLLLAGLLMLRISGKR